MSERKSNQQRSFRKAIGLLKSKSYELRFFNNENQLDTIRLNGFEFELLRDNLIGQKQLIKKYNGKSVEDLVAIFRMEDLTTINILFNSDRIKIFNFTKDISKLNFITVLNHKKLYSELSRM